MSPSGCYATAEDKQIAEPEAANTSSSAHQCDEARLLASGTQGWVRLGSQGTRALSSGSPPRRTRLYRIKDCTLFQYRFAEGRGFFSFMLAAHPFISSSHRVWTWVGTSWKSSRPTSASWDCSVMFQGPPASPDGFKHSA